jgi:hypothetical protein
MNQDDDARRSSADAAALSDVNGEPDAVASPVVPLPIGGFTSVGSGVAGGAAGVFGRPAEGMAPLSGGAITFGLLEEGTAAADTAGRGDAAGGGGGLADRVEQALAGDGRLGGAGIAVSVGEGGQVEISGSVASERERHTALEIAAGVPGVVSVTDRLTIG